MGGHSAEPPKVPDYRIYKVSDAPQLIKTQRMLAQHGLKDPWLRNEVWRYPPATRNPYNALNEVFFRKIKLGFALAALTIVGEKIYHHYYPEEHHHHH
ncbi:complex I-B12 [Caerostris extrusa]|uniref:NADH dehydrogenase [ubiquinone] 1 beta subcomplex subunit 3 n=1 Tax=Caerostris extrusa TaxID=172846 RepID=A0AAV4MJA7_CAEEX|nr:complex I-B12 [Caerostris extrusa]